MWYCCPLQLLEETGNGRDINRHFYSVQEAKDALDKPVVKALIDLCRFRNLHPAFQGQVSASILSDMQKDPIDPKLPIFLSSSS